MKKIKQFLATAAIASTILNVAPAPKAQAGIILTPVLVGIVVLVEGIRMHSWGLIVLGADGNMKQDSLEKALSTQYSFIDDRDVVSTLASTIREKAISAPVVDGKKLVTLSKDEVLNILAPTGLAELQPEAVAQLVQDLQ